jgi:predicted metalloprotease
MHAFATLGKRVARAALVVSLCSLSGCVAPEAPSASAWSGAATMAGDPPVRVTVADVDSSNAEAAAAYQALVTMWTAEFQKIGAAFYPPKLARYRRPIQTRCGVISPSNASYCLTENAIYFDDVFLAVQGKIAGAALNTDGDMAAVGIIAHEMGHAVAMQLGFRSRDSYSNEAVADCLAGVFARHSENDGLLEHGDLEEAFYGMASAADPTFEPSGDPDRDRRISLVLARNSHGTREQRTQNFDRGYRGGSGSCMAHFKQA